MRLLAHVNSYEERARLEGLLNDKGIPTYAQGETIGRGVKPSSSRWAMFVCLNDQFDDAIALLRDPNHEVANPVDVSEFNQAAGSLDLTPVGVWLTAALILAVLVLSGLVYLMAHQNA